MGKTKPKIIQDLKEDSNLKSVAPENPSEAKLAHLSQAAVDPQPRSLAGPEVAAKKDPAQCGKRKCCLVPKGPRCDAGLCSPAKPVVQSKVPRKRNKRVVTPKKYSLRCNASKRLPGKAEAAATGSTSMGTLSEPDLLESCPLGIPVESTSTGSKTNSKQGDRRPKKRVSAKACVLTSSWNVHTRAKAKRLAETSSVQPVTRTGSRTSRTFIKKRVKKRNSDTTDTGSFFASMSDERSIPKQKQKLLGKANKKRKKKLEKDFPMGQAVIEVGRSATLDQVEPNVYGYLSPREDVPPECKRIEDDDEVAQIVCPVRHLSLQDSSNETGSETESEGMASGDMHDAFGDSFDWTPADQYDMTLPGEYDEDQSHREGKKIPDWATGDEVVGTLFFQQPDLLQKIKKPIFPPCPTNWLPFPECDTGDNSDR